MNCIPTTQLTTKYSLGKSGVLQILNEAGVPLRRQGLNKTFDAAIRLYESDLSLTLVAEQLN